MTECALDVARARFHRHLCRSVFGMRSGEPRPNTADSSSKSSMLIAQSIMDQMPYAKCTSPPTAQGAGKLFTDIARDFLQDSLELLEHLRPWSFTLSTSQAKIGIGAYEQYAHLAHVAGLVESDPDLRSWLGTDYLVTPDLVVIRKPYDDAEINAYQAIVGDGASGRLAASRWTLGEPDEPILHASISCKWTIRSDRAQNSRLEGLNLLRNRKGRAPHICALTFEPLPARIESVAAGTGDIDCVYHAALYELDCAVGDHGTDGDKRSLDAMLQGRRLRDISDLPLDLLL